MALLLSARLARLPAKVGIAGTRADSGDALTTGDAWSHPSGRGRNINSSNSTDGRTLVSPADLGGSTTTLPLTVTIFALSIACALAMFFLVPPWSARS